MPPSEELKQKCSEVTDSSKEQFLDSNADFLSQMGVNVTSALISAQNLMTPEQQASLLTDDIIAELSNVRDWETTGPRKPGSASFPLKARADLIIAELSQDSADNPANRQTNDQIIQTLRNESLYGSAANYNSLVQRSESAELIFECLTQQVSSAEEFFSGDLTVANALTAGLIAALPGGLPLLDKYLRDQRQARRQARSDQNAGLTFGDIFDAFHEQSTLEHREQCYMLTHLYNLANIKKRIDHGRSEVTFTAPAAVNGQASYLKFKEPLKKLPYIEDGKNKSVLIDGVPFGLMNTLTQSPKKSAFFNMKNEVLSSLQPLMRFYKVVFNPEPTDKCQVEKEIEIKFDSHFTESDLSSMLSSKKVRSPGVGIKSFNFSYDGANFFASKKSIKAKFVISANSMSDLFKQRGSGDNTYRYSDLIIHTGGDQQASAIERSPTRGIQGDKINFRLKAVIGWQLPTNTTDRIYDSSVKKAINNSYVTLNLVPTTRNFEIDQAGRVTLSIDYLAYTEEYYDNPGFNVFTEPDVAKEQLKRKVKDLDQSKKCNVTAANLDKIDDNLNKQIQEEKEKSLRYIVESLINNELSSKIYQIRGLTSKNLTLFGNNGPFGAAAASENVGSLEKKIRVLSTQDVSELLDSIMEEINLDPNQTTGTSNEETAEENLIDHILSFFYLGDLVDVILSNISDSLEEMTDLLNDPTEFTYDGTQVDADILEQQKKIYKRYQKNFEKLRIVLGPVEIVSPTSYTSQIINLSDIPISVKHFMEWLSSVLLDKGESVMTLPSFMNQLINNYIIQFMNNDTCFGGRAKQRIQLQQTSMTDYPELEGQTTDNLTRICTTPNHICGGGSSGDYKVKCPDNSLKCTKRLFIPPNYTITGDSSILVAMGIKDDPRSSLSVCEEYNIMMFSAGRALPIEQLKGNKADDEEKGIFHYQIGRDRGIVKDISLSRTDSRGLAEVRYEQDGYDGLKQFRELYDHNIRTALDVTMFPGTYIFVDPKGFDPAAALENIDITELGLGGYLWVWKSDHSISPGSAETTIYTKWVASAVLDNVTERIGEGEETSETSRCENSGDLTVVLPNN